MINHVELLGRLLLAALLGSVIGFERERMNWAAGLRTHMLVSVGSALVMLVSAFGFADVQAGRASFSIRRGWPHKSSPASAFSARDRSCCAAR